MSKLANRWIVIAGGFLLNLMMGIALYSAIYHLPGRACADDDSGRNGSRQNGTEESRHIWQRPVRLRLHLGWVY